MATRGHWGGRVGFILAAAGGAVGLGNIWKFPYEVGQNGGAAFIILYLICILMVGFPLMCAEIFIGKMSQKNPVGAFRFFKNEKLPLPIIGYVGVFVGILILSYYSVITGWTFHYFIRSLSGFSGSDSEIRNIFNELYASPWINILFHTVVMTIVVAIISRGVQKGIETVSKILMPLLGIILLILTIYSLTTTGADKALEFLFSPDFSKINSTTLLKVMGTSFFTLSLGMGAMITYGSYLSKDISIAKSSIQIALIDTFVALMAGVMIFPIVFSYGCEPTAGPSLIFQTLPLLFSKMPGGQLVSIAFFALVIFAAVTSAISLLEVVVSFAVDEYGLGRKKATVIFGLIIWAVGILSAISSLKIGEKTFLDIFDGLTTHYLMPIGGLLTMLVFGWIVDEKMKKEEFASHPMFYKMFTIVTKVITPVLLLFVVLNEALGIG